MAAVVQADATLSLYEKHVHEAEMTWSEGRLRLAKNGFCDQHPSIQLRKKKWFGFKEKVLRPTCPRCEEEHTLKMEEYRIYLDAKKLALSSSFINYSNHTLGPTPTNLPRLRQPQWPTLGAPHFAQPASPLQVPACSQQPLHCLPTVAVSQPPQPWAPQQPHLQTSAPENAYMKKSNGRLELMMAAHPHKCGRNPQVMAPFHHLPGRSSSCCAVLYEIPEEETLPETNQNDSVSSLSSTMSRSVSMDHLHPYHSIACSSSHSLSVPLEEPDTRLNPIVTSTTEPDILCEESIPDIGHGSPNHSVFFAPEVSAMVDSKEVAADRIVKADSHQVDPKALVQSGMDAIKQEEKLRKQVGAIARPGSSDTLREITEAAKYAAMHGSSTDVKDCNATHEEDIHVARKGPVEDCVNKLNLKCRCQRPHEAQQALHELQALCQSSEDYQMDIVMGEGLRVVLGTMRSFPIHAGVQEEACWVLGTLACDNDDHKALIAEAGGIIAIISSIQELARNAKFQETACEVLTYLTEGHLLNKIAVCESGGVPAILRAMEQNVPISRVQIRACVVLGDLALAAPALVAESGGVEAIFAAMMEHKFDAGLQEVACATLGNLAANNETAKFLIAQAGGIGFVLAALKNFGPKQERRDTGVQEMACFALQSMAHDNANHKGMMVKCGALSELYGLLEDRHTEATVLKAACDTLVTIAQHHHAAKDSLAHDGGIHILVSILIGNHHDPSVQRAVCRVLTNLSHEHDKNKIQIASMGGINAILACMIDSADNAELLECAYNALTSLTVNDENKAVLAQACGIEYIVAGMGNHLHHAGVQEFGCRTLKNLAYCEPIREMIVECNGVAAVLAAMDNHRDNVTIQEKACGALRELAFNDANEIVIAEAGGIQAILVALKHHQGHKGLLRSACGALRNLSFHDNSCDLKIVEPIGFGSVFEALERFLRSDDVPSDNSSGCSSVSC